MPVRYPAGGLDGYREGDASYGPAFPMIDATLWGLLGASSLVLGAILAFAFDLPPRLRGLILAFGAGTLLSAVAYDLIEEAAGASATGIDVAVGFAAGAVTFFIGSVLIDRMSGGGAATRSSSGAARTQGMAVVLGAVLDGIPESLVLGLSLIGGAGISVPVLVAVFVSNVPESLSASEDLAEAGMSRARIIGLWAIVAVASGLASGLGFVILDGAATTWVVIIQSFAGGAILAMLVESMIPEAYEIGGRAVGLGTCLGFAFAAFLSLST